MNLNNQGVQVTAIIGIVLIVLALIGATVYAPSSNVSGLLTLIGGVITVLLGLAKLQSIGSDVKQVQEKASANTESIARVESKVDVVHGAVNGLNQAALANQAIVSKAEGKAEEKAEALDRLTQSEPETPILTQEIPPTDPRYLPPSPKPSA